MVILRSRRLAESAFAIVIGFTLAGAAVAADAPIASKSAQPGPAIGDTWTFSLTPYGWATSLSGSVTVKGHPTDIDASFFDILDHTQFPKGLFQASTFGEARYGRFGLLTDISYMKLGLGASLQRSRDIGRLAKLGIGVQAGMTIQMVIAEVAAAYEVAHWPSANSNSTGTALDLYAGARGWWQQGKINCTRAGTVGASGSVDWVDPVVGARLRHNFAPGLNLVVSGDVGGFDVGSRFSWQAIAALDYEFYKTNNVTWSGVIGYKGLYADYSRGSGLTRYEYDMTMHGPIFAITARW
jgi:hypothetical protein